MNQCRCLLPTRVHFRLRLFSCPTSNPRSGGTACHFQRHWASKEPCLCAPQGTESPKTALVSQRSRPCTPTRHCLRLGVGRAPAAQPAVEHRQRDKGVGECKPHGISPRSRLGGGEGGGGGRHLFLRHVVPQMLAGQRNYLKILTKRKGGVHWGEGFCHKAAVRKFWDPPITMSGF